MIRLQKAIAQAGLASRRKAERLIVEGKVRVNGDVVRELGTKVNLDSDRIEVNGTSIRAEPKVYYALNKPVGVVTTASDPEGRRTVVELVPDAVRVYPVGRLDYDTEGLLLLTNDGELAFRLAHPSYEIDKVYDVMVRGNVTNKTLGELARGVSLEDGVTRPARVRVLERFENAVLLRLTIHEGRNRQIRRMAEAVGHPVLSLRRVQFGPLTLAGLITGGWRRLDQAEVRHLYDAVSTTPGESF